MNTKAVDRCDSLRRYLVYFFVFAFPLVMSTRTLDAFVVPKATVLYLVALWLAALWLLRVVSSGEIRVLYGPLDFAMAGLALTLAISTLAAGLTERSLYGGYAAREGLYSMAAYLVLFLAGTNAVTSIKALRRMLTAFAAGAATLSAYVLLQVAGLDPWGSQVVGSTATMSDSVSLGIYLAVAAPVMLGWSGWLVRERFESWGWKALVSVIPTAVVYGALLTNQVRAARLGALVGTAFVVAAFLAARRRAAGSGHRPRFSRLLAMGLVVASVGVAASYAGGTLFVTSPEAISPRYLPPGRVFIWETAAKTVAAQPLIGHGVASLPTLLAKSKPQNWVHRNPLGLPLDRAHNVLGDFAVSGGLAAVFFFVLFAVMVLGGCLSAARRTPSAGAAALVAGLAGGPLAYWVAGLVQSGSIQVVPLVWLLCGTAVSAGALVATDRGLIRLRTVRLPHLPQIKEVKAATAAVIVLAGLLISLDVVRIWQSDIWAGKAAQSAARGDKKAAITALRRAAELNPAEKSYMDSLAAQFVEAGLAGGSAYDFEQAAAAYQKALQLDPDDASTYAKLGDLYAYRRGSLAGGYARAVFFYNEALRREPFSPLTLMKLGVVYAERQRMQDAEEMMSLAASVDGDNAEVVYNLASLQAQVGKLNRARHLYRRLLAINPNYPNAAETLREIEAAQNAHRK